MKMLPLTDGAGYKLFGSKMLPLTDGAGYKIIRFENVAPSLYGGGAFFKGHQDAHS